MGKDTAPSARAEALAEGGTAAEGEPGVPGGDPLGAAERSPVEGPAEAFSLRLDLLASSAGLGAGGSVAEGLAGFSGRNGRKGPPALGRGLRRRQLRPGKKRGACVGKCPRGKGTKWMVVVDGQGVPLGAHLDSATPHEVTLIETALSKVAVPRKGRGRPRKNPPRLIYDLAADSDPLRKRLKTRGIELICPHRQNRTKAPTQDGRKLRRYRRRWKMERSIAWLGNSRRLVVRYERHIWMYQAFFHLACLLITLRQF
jgi:transposase